jgi:hypothetical protein
LFSRWWLADRPRASPREGRLLRIQPAAILRIGNHMTEVLRRAVGEDESGPYVIYHCQSGNQASELYLKPLGSQGHCTLRWTQGDLVRELTEDEIEVFQPRLPSAKRIEIS